MSKLLIFDVDGVLEKEELIMKARHDNLIKHVADRLNITIKYAEQKYNEAKESLSSDKKHTSAYIMIKLGFSRKDYFKILDEVNPKGLITTHENCGKMLKILNQDHTLVTLSNSSKKSSIKTLEILKIKRFINRIYSSEDFNESKPSKNILRKIIKDRNFNSKDTFFIGNSIEKDIIPAHKLGITTILFDPYVKHPNPKEANFIIKDLIEIVEIV